MSLDDLKHIEYGLFLISNNLMMFADQCKREDKPTNEIQFIKDLQEIADTRIQTLKPIIQKLEKEHLESGRIR